MVDVFGGVIPLGEHPMQHKNCAIVGGTVFIQAPQDFERGATYTFELVFYTRDGEEIQLSPRVMDTFKRFFGDLVAKETRSSLNLPALKITTCPLFKSEGLDELAKKIARRYSRIFGGIRIDVRRSTISLCES